MRENISDRTIRRVILDFRTGTMVNKCPQISIINLLIPIKTPKISLSIHLNYKLIKITNNYIKNHLKLKTSTALLTWKGLSLIPNFNTSGPHARGKGLITKKWPTPSAKNCLTMNNLRIWPLNNSRVLLAWSIKMTNRTEILKNHS